MKRFTLYFLFVFTLLSCGGPDNQFRLKGEFTHLQQGEFFLYSPDGGIDRIDTIKIVGGEFEYTTPLSTPATFYLLYPNYSEHVIFAQGGDVIRVSGDARSLSTTRITGSEDNDIFTKFRLEHLGKPQTEWLEEAKNFIRQNPTSRISTYLFMKHFLQGEGAENQADRSELYNLLCQSQADNKLLIIWRQEIENRNKIAVGKKFPQFELVMRDSSVVNVSDYKGKYLLLTFWAGWNSNSTSLLFHTRRLRRQTNKELAAISYSLDVSPRLLASAERSDTVDWPNYCDFRGWNNTHLSTLGIRDIPYSVLVDTAQVVVAEGENFEKDILPHIKQIFNLK